MKDFLFEIGTEELPPERIGELVSSLAANIENGLKEHALTYGLVKTYSTPRRLAVLITNLIAWQPEQSFELRGPSIEIAFDISNQPTTAAEKFAKTCGVVVDQLDRIEDKKGKFLFCKTTKAGKATADLLPEIVTTSIKKLPIPRPMHWGGSKISFVRPVHWVVMLFGTEIIYTEILGVKTSNQTFGHRFHYPQAIVIPEAGQYEELLEKVGFVVADSVKRRQKICEQIAANVKIGSTIINENLLNEVTDLVEWPIALIGSFDSHFLEMPREALIMLMEKQQRYFPITDGAKNLLSQFVIISNIESKNQAQVIAGNERVIRARLTDAEYFYRNDLRVDLASHSEKLKSVVFQAKLGSLYDKTQRLKILAGFIAAKINANVKHAERSAELSKCDLMTSMVWEFPELQGIMGDYYARGREPEAVATALKEQYLPRFYQDEIPTGNVGCALALADRVDNLIGLFGINKIPSGEKDPFGLRRAATGIVRIILEKNLELDLRELLEQAWLNYAGLLENSVAIAQVLHFIYERLRYMYAEQGKSANTFRAVLARMPTDLLDFEKRFLAVTEFNKLAEASDLIEIYKRVKNILAKADKEESFFNKELATEQAELNLAEVIEKESQTIAELYKNKNYFEVLAVLVKAKPFLSTFFDEVMVMVEDKKLRLNRLALLKDLQNLFTLVADIQ
ncbi:glycine--tRNA ligase subunit beta [Gammaproteobacteria bacterium]